jgi:hypothetical protein
MAVHLKNLILPALAGAATWFAVPLEFWHDARSSLLTAFSVIAGAVMVRLARGLPFTNADHFEVEEIRQVTTAIKQIMRSLLALIVVVLATMIGFTFVDRAAALFVIYGLPTTVYIANHALSAVLGFLLAFVLMRIIQVVRGDYGLVELQSKFMIRAVERKEVKKFDEARASADGLPYVTPPGYGQLVQ